MRPFFSIPLWQAAASLCLLLALQPTRLLAQNAHSTRDYVRTNGTATYVPLAISTSTGLSLANANNSVKVALPFSFPFQGRLYDSLWITSRGYVSLGSVPPTQAGNAALAASPISGASGSNVRIKAASFPDGIIAALAGSWQTSTVSTSSAIVYGRPSTDRFVVEYKEMAQGGQPTSKLSFQIILNSNGNIRFHFGNFIAGTSPVGRQMGLRTQTPFDFSNVTSSTWTSFMAGTLNSEAVSLSSFVEASVPNTYIDYAAPTLPAKSYASLPFSMGFENTWTSSGTSSGVTLDQPSAHVANWPRSGSSSARRSNADGHINGGTGTATDLAGSGWLTVDGNSGTFNRTQAGNGAARMHLNSTQPFSWNDLDFYADLSPAGYKILEFYTATGLTTSSLGVMCMLSTDGGRKFNLITADGASAPYLSTSNNWGGAWKKHSINMGNINPSQAIVRIRTFNTATFEAADVFLDEVSITVCTPPATPTISAAGPTSLCTGESVTLTADGGSAWLWSTGATTQSITVSTAGSYWVKAVGSNCNSASSAATVVTLTSTPSQPTIIADGPTTFNSGGSVGLSAPDGFSYLWSTGATTQDIIVTTSGSYTVQTINGTCTSATSSPEVVTVNTPPASLTVSNGQSLTATGSYDNITVAAGGTLTLTGDVTLNGAMTVNGTLNTNGFNITGAGSFALASGGTLNITSAQGIASSGATGNVQNTGSRSFASNATYIYSGSTQVTGTGLPGTVRNLTSTVSGTLTLTSPTTVTSIVDVTSGILNTNDQLTLQSTATSTASLLTPTGGSNQVSGLVTVQRYINPSYNAGAGYRHISFPLSSVVWNTVNVSGGSLVFNTDYNTAANPGSVSPFPTVFGYEGSGNRVAPLAAFSDGWVAASATGSAVAGNGYSLNIPANSTISATGNIISSNLQMIYNQAEAGEYILAGNPFTAPIRYAGLLRFGSIANVHYRAQSTGPYAGRYASFVVGSGVGVNGGTDTIPMGAGFFIQALSRPCTLNFVRAARVRTPNNYQVFRQAAQPLARFELNNGTVGDESVIHFHANATAGFDNDLDANRMPGGMALYTHGAGKYYSINSNPEHFLTDGAVHTFALGYTAQNAGQHTIKLKEVSALDGQVITLIDNQLNTATVMNAGDVYTFQAAAGSNLTRFVITIGAQATSAKGSILSGLSVFPNPAKDRLDVSGLGQGASIQLINAVGQTVRTANASYSTSFDLNDLAAGVYTLRIAQDGQTVTQKVVKQ